MVLESPLTAEAAAPASGTGPARLLAGVTLATASDGEPERAELEPFGAAGTGAAARPSGDSGALLSGAVELAALGS